MLLVFFSKILFTRPPARIIKQAPQHKDIAAISLPNRNVAVSNVPSKIGHIKYSVARVNVIAIHAARFIRVE